MVAILCKCGKTYQVDDAYAGRTVRCRRCGEVHSVPKQQPAATLPTPPAVYDEQATPPSAPVNSVPVHQRARDRRAAVGVSQGEYHNQEGYSVVQEFAHGGQGKISVARDLALKRDVTLKELLEGVANVPGNERRFVAEAEITGQLEHPGIVPIYALGADKDGNPFYTMRLVAGQTLKEAIDECHCGAGVSPAKPGFVAGVSPARQKAGGTPAPQMADLKGLLRHFVMVCQTVAFAHNRGVIHRDLKPANIMLGRFGETLVMDWGLAKPLRDGESDESTLGAVADQQLADRPDLTATDAIVGTPAYMPPEQALGKANEVGVEADIYALGAVLYHLLTGTPPYTGGSSLEVLKKVATEPPPKPSQVCRGVPRALEAICLKAMARRRKDRYRTANELARSVERWLDDEPVDAYKEPRLEQIYRWSRKHKAAVVSGAIALAVVLVVGSLATVVIQRERDIATANERLADRYKREAHDATIKAEQKEAEANRLAKEADASRREAIEANQQEALARQAADEANKQITEVQAALAAKSGESEELTKKIEAAKSDLAAAQTRMEEESKRANTATDHAAELERQVVALRREAEEYREITLKLTRLAAEVANPQQAPSVEENTPWNDFADRDPGSFDILSSDRSEGNVVADTEREHTGRQSLRVSTVNGGGVTVTYPKSRNANWDLSPYDYVNFAFSLGDADVRYRESGLSVRIGRGSQCIEYHAKPEALSLVPKGWARVRIPLWGGRADPLVWRKKEDNALDLSHVDWIEFHISTFSPKLTVWLDDLRFGDSRHADPPLLPDPDRAAAEYIVATKGTAEVWVNGKTVTIRMLADIPREPFKVVSVTYTQWAGKNVTDVGLKLFGMLTDCRSIGLGSASISDGGLEHLKNMKSLEALGLTWCPVNGSGLTHLASLPKLSSLGLNSTGISDEGMAYVARLPKLTYIDLTNTAVTDEGLKRLAAHPTLSSIDVHDTPVSVEGLTHLKFLPGGLQYLTIGTPNCPNGIGFLEGASLRRIIVSAERSKGRVEESFLKSISMFPELTEVGLHHTMVDAKEIEHLRDIPHLRALFFYAPRTFFPEKGINESAYKQMSALSKLQVLDVYDGGTISDANLQELGKVKSLTELRLNLTTVEPASVLKLQVALPNCKITVDEPIQKAIDALRGKK
jgi:serine/threonine protein kinase